MIGTKLYKIYTTHITIKFSIYHIREDYESSQSRALIKKLEEFSNIILIWTDPYKRISDSVNRDYYSIDKLK